MVRQHVNDHGGSRKYFTQVPNMVDDSDLSPYARVIYLHFLRIAAQHDTCEETMRETAQHCHMSRSSVANARVELEEKRWIEVENIGSHGRGSDQVIHLLDRWVENGLRYDKRYSSENGIVHHMDNSPEPDGAAEPTGIVQPAGQPVDNSVQPVDNSVQPVDIPACRLDNSISPSLLTVEIKKKKKGEEARARAHESPQPREDRFVDPEPCPKPVPRRTRYDQVLELIQRADPDLAVGGSRERNEPAVNGSPAPIALIAEAYLALMTGRWRDAFVQKQGSLWAVVENLGGYQAIVVRGLSPPGRGGGRGGGARREELETFSTGVLV